MQIPTCPTPGIFDAPLDRLTLRQVMNFIRYHGLFAPNSPHRAAVTPARGGRKVPGTDAPKTPAECRAAMSWAQRLKRVFNFDIETCEDCSGMVKIIASIND